MTQYSIKTHFATGIFKLNGNNHAYCDVMFRYKKIFYNGVHVSSLNIVIEHHKDSDVWNILHTIQY